MPEIYRTSLLTGRPQEELRLTLFSSPEASWLQLEIYHHDSSPSGEPNSGAPMPRSPVPGPPPIILSLALWPQFHEAVCCLGAFMIPLPAPAYQTRACCTYTCTSTPENVVLGEAGGEQILLSLQDRRGSTFLEIKVVKPGTAATDIREVRTIPIGPTTWSAFLKTLDKLNQIITEL